jgi:hypothetical protein
MLAMSCKRTSPIPPLLALSILSLSACSTPDGDFPSLSKRPYESAQPIAEPEAAPTVTTNVLPASLSANTNRLLERDQIANAAFVRARIAAESSARAGSGAAKGSESWVQAQMVLSRLDAARADSVTVLGEIDGLIALERIKGADAGLIGLLETTQARIAASVANQEAEIRRLSATIGQ